MANNLRLFNTNSEYQSADLILPSVSYVVETDKVIYDLTPPTPPTPSFKWKATYSNGNVTSAECDSSSEITQNEINLANLVSVEVGDCVTSIGKWAFYNCSSLTSVTISSGVTSIGNYAFTANANKVVTVFPSTPPTIASNYLRPFTRNYVTIYVPSELVDTYKAASGWSFYADRIQPIP